MPTSLCERYDQNLTHEAVWDREHKYTKIETNKTELNITYIKIALDFGSKIL